MDKGSRPDASMRKIPRLARWHAAALLLAVLVVAVYWQVGQHAFIGFDDPVYITRNPHVLGGLTAEGITWAFTTPHSSNWHPLTWISHMLDVEMFGLDAGWHHRVNVLFHLANTLALFLLLRRMTAELWQSAFAAALFAVHPLHVESVAWAAERKDVLSTLFWLLTMWAYLAYVRDPRVRRYVPVAMCFALGLMSKPMLVTLPFALLLLDWWPLRRIGEGPGWIRNASRRFAEKVPLMALAAASCVITYVVQTTGGSVAPDRFVPLDARISNAIVSYVEYLRKTVWPASLTLCYPHPSSIGAGHPWTHVAGAVILLIAVSILVLRERRRRPYAVVGWFWYLGTLVPVIGVVQVGMQAMADRYTYVPLIGIFVIVAWGLPDLLAGWRFRKPALGIAAAISLTAFSAAAWIQTGYWRDSITVFSRAVQVTEKNWIALCNLGLAYKEIGQVRQAIPYFREALRIRPYDHEARSMLGDAHGNLGEHRQAIAEFEEALRYKKDDARAWSGLGAAHLHLGEPRKAIPFFQEALRIRADDAKAMSDLGVAFMEAGELPKAVDRFRDALRIRPGEPVTWNNLGSAHLKLGQPEQAIPCFREALRIQPDYSNALYNLGLAYEATGRRKQVEEVYGMLRLADPEMAAAFREKHDRAR